MSLPEMLEELAAMEVFFASERSRLKPLEEAIDNLRAAVMAKLNQEGLDTAKTKDGHRVSIVQNRSTRVVDAEAYFDFVFDTGDSSFLQKRVNAEAVLQFVEQNDGQLPPGIELTTVNTLRFTKSKE